MRLGFILSKLYFSVKDSGEIIIKLMVHDSSDNAERKFFFMQCLKLEVQNFSWYNIFFRLKSCVVLNIEIYFYKREFNNYLFYIYWK